MEPRFTHEELLEKINKLITDPIYVENIKRLQALVNETGGLPETCRLIENAAKNGIQHLIDPNLEIIRQRSPRRTLSILAAVAIVGWLYLKSKKEQV